MENTKNINKAAAVKEETMNKAAGKIREDNVINNEELIRTIIITPTDDKQFKMLGELVFDIQIKDDGNFETAGQLRTNILMDDTDIAKIETWRYELTDVTISNIHCDSRVDDIIYTFKAKNFSIKA